MRGRPDGGDLGGAAVLDGVVHDQSQGPPQQAAVRVQRAALVDIDEHLLRLYRRVPDAGQEAGYGDAAEVRGEHSGVEPAEHQQLLDQAGETGRGHLRPFQHVPTLLGTEALVVDQERVEEAVDDGDRGAELV